MVTVKLYVEGAAQKNDLMRARCREAFRVFFETAGITGRPRTVPCGGRQKAYDAFVTAVRTAEPGDLPLLLVDSEDPVTAGDSNWRHLKRRDNWDRPGGAKDDQVFLMVQVMESWFLADPDALRHYFGPDFSDKPFRAWPALEGVPKPTVYDVLENATADCKQPYKKGDVSFEILGRLDATKVEAACPHAKALLNRLRSL